jgi:hypothetical protein
MAAIAVEGNCLTASFSPGWVIAVEVVNAARIFIARAITRLRS